MRTLVLTLVGAALTLITVRLVKTAVWLLLRPGGWAVLTGGTIVALAATRSG